MTRNSLYRYLRTVSFLTVPVATLAGQGQAARPAPDDLGAERYVWNLTALFADQTAWENERARVEAGLSTIGRLRGTIASTSGEMATALETISALRIGAGKLTQYAWLRHIEDIGDSSRLIRYRTSLGLENRVEAATAFADAAVGAMSDGKFDQFMREEARLFRHRQRIGRMRRNGRFPPAQLTAALLGPSRAWPGGSQSAYQALLADAAVSRGGNRRAYAGALRTWENTAGALLNQRLEVELHVARQRGLRSGMDATLFEEGIPAGANAYVSEVVRGASATMRRFLSLRRRVLGLDSASYDDVLVPSAVSLRIPVSEALSVATAAASVFGASFQAKLQDRLRQPWYHLPALPEKMNNEFGTWYSVGGTPPYTFLKYEGSYLHANNLAGLTIPVVAFSSLPEGWTPDSRDSPSVYGEALYNAGRILFQDEMRARTTDRRVRVAMLMTSLDELHRAVIRRAITNEFEAFVEQRLLDGRQPVGGSEMSRWYLGLLQTHYGHDRGGVAVDSSYGGEWIASAASFESSRTILWAMAVSAACLLVERARAGDVRALRLVDSTLGIADSELSYDLLRAGGIDLALRTPYEAVIRRMNALMDALEQELRM